MPPWVLVILAILIVVGSVVWVRPSPRDKKLATWRRDALVAGLKVSLQGLKAEPKHSGIRDDVEGASYILYNPASQKGDECSWAVVKTQGWLQEDLPESWSWYKENGHVPHDQVAQLILECPLDVLAIERTPVSSRVIWKENGSEFSPEVLKGFLEKVQMLNA